MKTTIVELKDYILSHPDMSDREVGEQCGYSKDAVKYHRQRLGITYGKHVTINETGKRFGKLLVICKDEKKYPDGLHWICRCDCGNITSVKGANLRCSHPIRSCGCSRYIPPIKLWNNGVWRRIDKDTIECCKCGMHKPIGKKTSSYKTPCKCSRISKLKVHVNHCCVCGATIDKYLKKCDACKEEHRLAMLPVKRSRRNASNRLREARAKANGKIDWTINLQGLIERDRYRCALCGELIDINDYSVRGGAFIAGDNYPSIDHIIPLSRGGAHSWKNVQLAHFRCNTLKGNAI